MKIIEAMKRIKHLQEKCADLRGKVAQFCAGLGFRDANLPRPEGTGRGVAAILIPIRTQENRQIGGSPSSARTWPPT